LNAYCIYGINVERNQFHPREGAVSMQGGVG